MYIIFLASIQFYALFSFVVTSTFIDESFTLKYVTPKYLKRKSFDCSVCSTITKLIISRNTNVDVKKFNSKLWSYMNETKISNRASTPMQTISCKVHGSNLLTFGKTTHKILTDTYMTCLNIDKERKSKVATIE